MSDPQALNVLFLCTHNSARSILAEAMLNHMGKGRFVAYSAGSSPRAQQQPHPLALETLRKAGVSTEGLHSKSWDEFAAPGAPVMDFVFTVCDQAAGETCPIWPGQPIQAHWGVPDPASAQGSEAEIALAFADAYRQLRNRITIFAALPIESLDRLALKRKMDEIGATRDAPARA